MNEPPLISVIVPTRNSAPTLDACLTSINQQTYPRIELIVVDRDSDDRTEEIARAHRARFLSAHPERSAQRNAGARVARGEVLLFIDSDMVLEPNVVQACQDVFRRQGETTALVIPERGFSDTLLARVRSLEKRCYVGNSAVEAARFFPRERFVEVGGFDEDLSGCEDWDLTDRWRAAGGHVSRVEAFIIHDDRVLSLVQLLRKRFFYGRQFLPFLHKDRKAALTHLRPGRFLSRGSFLAREPLTAVSLVLIKILETGAFALGVLAGWLRRSDDVIYGRTRRAAEALRDVPGARVLDVGCSGGWLARSNPDRQVIGTDLQRPIDIASWGIAAQADACALPFASRSFDVVCFFDVLEHVPRGMEVRALTEIRRVLRPGGTLLLSTPHRHPLGTTMDPAWWLRGHRHYHVSAVQAMLARAGFADTTLHIYGGASEALYLPLFYLFQRLRLRLPFERRWQKAIDREYRRPGWYTIFASARRPASAPEIQDQDLPAAESAERSDGAA